MAHELQARRRQQLHLVQTCIPPELNTQERNALTKVILLKKLNTYNFTTNRNAEMNLANWLC